MIGLLDLAFFFFFFFCKFKFYISFFSHMDTYFAGSICIKDHSVAI